MDAVIILLNLNLHIYSFGRCFSKSDLELTWADEGLNSQPSNQSIGATTV